MGISHRTHQFRNPCTSPSRVSNGLAFVSILEKNDDVTRWCDFIWMVFFLKTIQLMRRSDAHFNIKMSSDQYRNSHYRDKMVSQTSYIYNWNPYAWKDHLYFESCPKFLNIYEVTVQLPYEWPILAADQIWICVCRCWSIWADDIHSVYIYRAFWIYHYTLLLLCIDCSSISGNAFQIQFRWHVMTLWHEKTFYISASFLA